MSKHVRKILPLLLCLLLMACLLPAAYADGVKVSTLAELQAALNNSQNCVSTGKIGGPGSGIELTVPTGVTLDITSGFVCVSSMTVNGTVNVGDNGMLMVDQSLTGSGAINVAAGCQTFNLPAACYDSETHELVSLIHNNCSNVTLVHIPATYAELQSALLKAEDAAEHGIGSGILIAQDLTIPQNEEVLLGNMVLSVQYGAKLTLDDGAVVVTKQDVMVEQSSIHVRGGAVLAASVQLNASTIDFNNGGGFFGTNAAHPFENPTPLTNALHILCMLLVPSALTYAFGRMLLRRRQGWIFFAAFLVLFVGFLSVVYTAEQAGNPALTRVGADQEPRATQSGGNMEGKEVRFGIAGTSLFVATTTAATTGSVRVIVVAVLAGIRARPIPKHR